MSTDEVRLLLAPFEKRVRDAGEGYSIFYIPGSDAQEVYMTGGGYEVDDAVKMIYCLAGKANLDLDTLHHLLLKLQALGFEDQGRPLDEAAPTPESEGEVAG